MHPLRPAGRLTSLDQPIFWPRFARGRKSLVDPLRPFFNSRRYRFRGFSVPGTARLPLAARQQVEDQISVLPGSFLLMITGHTDVAFPDDFRFDITEKQSGRSVSSAWLAHQAGCGGARLVNQAGRFGAARGLPFILPDPWVVTEPGLVLVRITNLATTTNRVELLLQFAEPIGGA